MRWKLSQARGGREGQGQARWQNMRLPNCVLAGEAKVGLCTLLRRVKPNPWMLCWEIRQVKVNTFREENSGFLPKKLVIAYWSHIKCRMQRIVVHRGIKNVGPCSLPNFQLRKQVNYVHMTTTPYGTARATAMALMGKWQQIEYQLMYTDNNADFIYVKPQYYRMQ